MPASRPLPLHSALGAAATSPGLPPLILLLTPLLGARGKTGSLRARWMKAALPAAAATCARSELLPSTRLSFLALRGRTLQHPWHEAKPTRETRVHALAQLSGPAASLPASLLPLLAWPKRWFATLSGPAASLPASLLPLLAWPKRWFATRSLAAARSCNRAAQPLECRAARPLAINGPRADAWKRQYCAASMPLPPAFTQKLQDRGAAAYMTQLQALSRGFSATQRCTAQGCSSGGWADSEA